MAFGPDYTSFRVTETQKTITAKALEAVTLRPVDPEDPILEDLSRMIVVIQKGYMDAYYKDGFDWSCRARFQRDPFAVAVERVDLEHTVNEFHERIDQARGEGARRIRGNRVRRAREYQRIVEAEERELNEQRLQWEAWREYRRAVRQQEEVAQ
jgi:hypothetical protein